MRDQDARFWFWGAFPTGEAGRCMYKKPKLFEKIPGVVRDILIGHHFIVALRENGQVWSCGEDNQGCLGLGTQRTSCDRPAFVTFPRYAGAVLDIQHGCRHILALTDKGKVYTWGDNQHGQLGHGDTQARFQPEVVQELEKHAVIQILVVDNRSYALTSGGVVFAWGENRDRSLATDSHAPGVVRPEPVVALGDSKVEKLLLKECGGTGCGSKGGRTVIALLCAAAPLKVEEDVGGFSEPLGSHTPRKPNMVENVLSSVEMMRRVVGKMQTWWHHVMTVRHGGPYEDDISTPREFEYPPPNDHCSMMQLDTFTDLVQLEEACLELQKVMQSVKAQMNEVNKLDGAMNLRFLLALFLDDCKMRHEKIRRTVAARELMEVKKGMQRPLYLAGTDVDEAARLKECNEYLTKTLQQVRSLRQYDLVTRALQDSITESIERTIQVHEYQDMQLKDTRSRDDVMQPCLRQIKERWGALKNFSLGNMYQEYAESATTKQFESADELMALLVSVADSRIDQIISQDKDTLVARDMLVPGLCYDLLVENAELRKMCNAHQLKVLLYRDGNAGALDPLPSAVRANFFAPQCLVVVDGPPPASRKYHEGVTPGETSESAAPQGTEGRRKPLVMVEPPPPAGDQRAPYPGVRSISP